MCCADLSSHLDAFDRAGPTYREIFLDRAGALFGARRPAVL
jgi:hypothetical protein